jgi:hypothetical protein
MNIEIPHEPHSGQHVLRVGMVVSVNGWPWLVVVDSDGGRHAQLCPLDGVDRL